MASHIQTLRALLRDEKGVLLPGAPNALTARIIEDLGFKAVYLTGAGLTNSDIGLPDLGFMDLSQVAEHVLAIRGVVELPLIVDIDTGFGNALNVAHTIRTLEQAGASAVQLEDQRAPKRCGHFEGKALISAEEMVGKVRAAADARRQDMVIIARTDACAVEGFEAAIVLFANAALQAAIHGMQTTLRALKATGVLDERMVTSFAERQRLVGQATFDAMEVRYAAGAPTRA